MNIITKEKKQILNEIKYNYGLNESSNDLLKSYYTTGENKIWDLQEAMVEFILNDATLRKYAPYWKYRRTFLKTLISLIEDFDEEVNETFLEDYITLINSGSFVSDDQGKYFLVVFPKDIKGIEDVKSNTILIEQYANIISNGTTGLHVWPACYQLVDYLKINHDIFNNKSVLELGCGLGLLGLNCLKICKPKKYLFTDSHQKVLNQLKSNILYNYDSSKQETNDLIEVERLDWTDLDNCELFKESRSLDIDIILASDIIFDPDLMPDLVNTLKFIWEKNTNKNLFLLISSTIRNTETYGTFMNHLKIANFQHVTLEKNTCNLKNSCNSTPTSCIELLKIFK